MSIEYDFIVGFTLFTPKGFRTMYRHFDNLEVAKIFASNVDLKNNHKIYVDLDLYNEEKEERRKVEKQYRQLQAFYEKDYIRKDKIRDLIVERKFELQQEYKDFEDDIKLNTLNELLEE